jgi:hypothetical protein
VQIGKADAGSQARRQPCARAVLLPGSTSPPPSSIKRKPPPDRTVHRHQTNPTIPPNREAGPQTPSQKESTHATEIEPAAPRRRTRSNPRSDRSAPRRRARETIPGPGLAGALALPVWSQPGYELLRAPPLDRHRPPPGRPPRLRLLHLDSHA